MDIVVHLMMVNFMEWTVILKVFMEIMVYDIRLDALLYEDVCNLVGTSVVEDFVRKYRNNMENENINDLENELNTSVRIESREEIYDLFTKKELIGLIGKKKIQLSSQSLKEELVYQLIQNFISVLRDDDSNIVISYSPPEINVVGKEKQQAKKQAKKKAKKTEYILKMCFRSFDIRSDESLYDDVCDLLELGVVQNYIKEQFNNNNNEYYLNQSGLDLRIKSRNLIYNSFTKKELEFLLRKKEIKFSSNWLKSKLIEVLVNFNVMCNLVTCLYFYLDSISDNFRCFI